MQLLSDFQFSQSSLQDFATCPRRFYWRYLAKLRYPAPETTPLLLAEAHMARGAAFHRMIEQYFRGIPADAIESAQTDDQIDRWWADFLRYALADLPERRLPEQILSIPVETPNGTARLTAKYDLIALGTDGALICDWKTSFRRPSRETLARRLQTIVYRYVLARAGAAINGGNPLRVDQIQMRYWFTAQPEAPETFRYDAEQYRQDGAIISGLISSILARDNTADAFPLTDDMNACAFCNYRALCDRGTQAGDFREIDAEEDEDLASFTLSLDQVGEIAF